MTIEPRCHIILAWLLIRGRDSTEVYSFDEVRWLLAALTAWKRRFESNFRLLARWTDGGSRRSLGAGVCQVFTLLLE